MGRLVVHNPGDTIFLRGSSKSSLYVNNWSVKYGVVLDTRGGRYLVLWFDSTTSSHSSDELMSTLFTFKEYQWEDILAKFEQRHIWSHVKPNLSGILPKKKTQTNKDLIGYIYHPEEVQPFREVKSINNIHSSSSKSTHELQTKTPPSGQREQTRKGHRGCIQESQTAMGWRYSGNINSPGRSQGQTRSSTYSGTAAQCGRVVSQTRSDKSGVGFEGTERRIRRAVLRGDSEINFNSNSLGSPLDHGAVEDEWFECTACGTNHVICTQSHNGVQLGHYECLDCGETCTYP